MGWFDKKEPIEKGQSYDQTYSIFDLFRGEGANIDIEDSIGNIFVEQSGVTNSGESVHVDNLLEETTVLSCINAITQGITQVPVEVRRKLEDGTTEVVKNHPIAELMKKPNDFLTRSEFISSIVTSILTHGNCFLYIVRAGTDNRAAVELKHGVGRPIQILPLEPSDMTLGADVFGRPVYTHETEGLIPRENIIHIRDLQTFVPQGLSRALLASEIIGAKKAADRLIAETFAKAGSIQYVITSDVPVDDTKQKKFMQGFFAGFGRAGTKRNSAAFMAQGDIKKIDGIKPADVDLRELREMLKREIAGVFKVPPAMVGIDGDQKYNNVRQQWAGFHRDTLQPLVTNIEEAITLKLLPKKDEYLFFDVAELLKGDVETTARIAQDNVQAGIWTPNEGRTYIGTGLHDDEMADMLITPNSTETTTTTIDDGSNPGAATGGSDGPQSDENNPGQPEEREQQNAKR